MERNRLIANFMGFEHEGESLLNYNNGNPNLDVSDLKYSSSWDWLMPVISKIYDTAEGEQGREEDLIGDITHRLVDVDIDETYKSVVEFIKWFNKKNNII